MNKEERRALIDECRQLEILVEAAFRVYGTNSRSRISVLMRFVVEEIMIQDEWRKNLEQFKKVLESLCEEAAKQPDL